MLARLPLAAIREPEHRPLVGPGDGVEPPQNSGVTPMYVGSRSSLPSLPFLISQATCVPNWKLRRLSSIDQLLFVQR